MTGPLSLLLFDDETARGWEPFALTRPAGELLFGVLTLRARAERVLGARCVAHICAPHLLGFEEAGAPPTVLPERVPTAGDRLFLLSRAVPDWGARWDGGPRHEGPVLMGGQVAGWFAPAGAPAPPGEFFLRPDTGAETAAPPIELPGRVLAHVWDLVPANPAQVADDVRALFPAPPPVSLPEGVYRIGEHPLVLTGDARLEPGCVIDTEEGPVWIDAGARVRAFTRLSGPAYVGPRTQVLGGTVAAVSLGPVCRVRGELAESVCLGYTNKQHDGHMGHAYLGRWVNLGAETTNSDLKNNYGHVRLWTPDGPADTGQVKLGCFLGDHVKTGIGLLLNTGTVVGAGSNLYGAAMPPTYVPPFSWGTGEELVEYRLDKFLEVAERAMARRDVPLSPPQREQLARAWRHARSAAGT